MCENHRLSLKVLLVWWGKADVKGQFSGTHIQEYGLWSQTIWFQNSPDYVTY